MDFAELLEMLRNPGDDGPPETIYDDLTTAHSTVAETADGAGAKVAELSQTVEALTAENLRLKAANFDLMTQVPQDGEPAENTPDEDSDDGDGIDSLFDGDPAPTHND